MRIVFDGAVISLPLGTDATLEDLARTLGDLSGQGYGDAVAIAVTLPDVALGSYRHSDA